MDKNFESINQINIKTIKNQKEIKKYKKRLYKDWESIKKAKDEVMINTNALLDMIQFIELDSVINHNTTRTFKEQLNLIPNLGFSKEDGYSENPSGEVDIISQVFVFDLLRSTLKLHDNILYFIRRQADIVSILWPDHQKRTEAIIAFYSELFPQELTRKQCFDTIIKVFEEEGIVSYSESYIKKQLSNWNIYKPSIRKKGKRKRNGPLPGYENARRNTVEFFEKWVRDTYVPYHILKQSNRSFSPRKRDTSDVDSIDIADLDAADKIREEVDNHSNL